MRQAVTVGGFFAALRYRRSGVPAADAVGSRREAGTARVGMGTCPSSRRSRHVVSSRGLTPGPNGDAGMREADRMMGLDGARFGTAPRYRRSGRPAGVATGSRRRAGTARDRGWEARTAQNGSGTARVGMSGALGIPLSSFRGLIPDANLRFRQAPPPLGPGVKPRDDPRRGMVKQEGQTDGAGAGASMPELAAGRIFVGFVA